MVKEITLRQVGGSVGATIPKDMADRFNLEPGDRILAIETHAGVLFSPYDADTIEALAIAAESAKEYRNALRKLAQ